MTTPVMGREALRALATPDATETHLPIAHHEIVEIEGRGPVGWRFVEYSPFNPR
jgi:hypothetical protein